MQITMHTARVLADLKANRQKHIKEYTEQGEGWKVKMEEYNKEMVLWSQGGGIEKRPTEPYRPQDFSKDYDKLILVLKNHILEQINIDEHDLDAIIHDKFGWTERFGATSAVYNNR